LRKLGAKSYIDLVAKSIYDKCADVRMNVVKFFEVIRYDRILPKLISLADDENRWVRILLAKALKSYSPSKKALNTLFYLIKDKEIWVRIYAYTSLSYYPLKKEYRDYYLRIFHQGLLDKNKIIRKVSAVRLYELKDKTSLPFFKKAMKIYSDDAIVLKIGTRLISKFHTINIDNFVKKANKLKEEGLEWIKYPLDTLLERYLAEPVIDEVTGEVLYDTLIQLNENRLKKIIEAGVKEIDIINDLA
jgi:HEAT repeat protein